MHCHANTSQNILANGGSIALVGHPNVGKSALFHRLTGQRVVVSNYPGTTVELTRGTARSLPGVAIIDTPGVIAFPPYSDDEVVTARVLFSEDLSAILQVGDAKNLRRTLLLTLQLAEMGRPLALALNMMDEARARGIQVDSAALGASLGIAVLPTAAVQGQGVEDLPEALQTARTAQVDVRYDAEIENAVADFTAALHSLSLPITARALGLLFLSGDALSECWLAERLSPDTMETLSARRGAMQARLLHPAAVLIQQARLAEVERLSGLCLSETASFRESPSAFLGRLTTHPVWGLFCLASVLTALYWFVGIFGAGTLVGLLEEKLFGEMINPAVTGFVQHMLPWPWLSDLFVGPYGLWTMGMTYAVALIFPIVTTFFFAFGIMEDSGYLPRLAALSNRMFKALGLNGKAVLPMVLGLGCVTMATLTTRVMESKRERFLVTLLLALAVPCSAQLGVVMGMLAGISLTAALIWSGVVMGVLLAVGWLAARLVPGERTMLLVDLPPLRLPQLSNVLMKTGARLEWYVKEVVPLFLLGALLMYGLDRTGLLALLEKAGEPVVVGWLGLPPEASAAFLMGFLRRDFGATGLFVMQSQGLLNPQQVVVSMVTITLFIPCIASVMMIAKERGNRTAFGMFVLITPLALLVGAGLHRLLHLLGWGI
jgi:ferrous iron transport protein B